MRNHWVTTTIAVLLWLVVAVRQHCFVGAWEVIPIRVKAMHFSSTAVILGLGVLLSSRDNLV